MSAELPPSTVTQQLNFAPLHRTAELENIHEQVKKSDSNQQQEKPKTPTGRKILMKHMTVIGDGHDVDFSSQ